LTYHQLFSEEGDNRCLYCQGVCTFFAGEGNWTSALEVYFIDKYTCQSCEEIFGVHYIYPIDNVVGFEFSCQDLVMLHHYKGAYIKVAHKSNLQEAIEVPAFDYDFTDGESLYMRLRTCLTFA
jgi:hypothetical protein